MASEEEVEPNTVTYQARLSRAPKTIMALSEQQIEELPDVDYADLELQTAGGAWIRPSRFAPRVTRVCD